MDSDLVFRSIRFWEHGSYDGEEPMRKSRFNDEDIVAILRESDRTSVAEAAKWHKVSEQTIHA